MNVLKINQLPAFFTITLLLLFTVPAHAQNDYPKTLRVPVTFYDFHSDSSNPEFEVNPPTDQVRTGMVATSLDSEKKPAIGSAPFYNRMITRWFRPWTPGDKQIYNYYAEYEEGKRYDRYSTLPAGFTMVDHDTSFKNIIIHDTLTFTYVDGSKGMYEFSSDAFFPLDERGFGNEKNEHNYSFTMEMHWTFTMVPGLTFNFQGDDDVWAFVNDSLVMDLGGIHNPAFGQFTVDNLAGLTPNRQYSFDLFYAERHVTGSNIRISTNIIAHPSVLQLYDNSNPPGSGNLPITSLDSIRAGDSMTVYGHVFDSMGVWQPKYDEVISWRIEGASTGISLSTEKGPSTIIITDGSLNGTTITLIASFTNPDNSSALPIEARISGVVFAPDTTGPDIPDVPDPPDTPYVPDIPDIPPDTPDVPDTPDIPDVPVTPQPVEDHLDILLDSALAYAPQSGPATFAFLPGTEFQRLFAVVRDKDGNFIRFATQAEWQSLDIAVATVIQRYGPSTVLSRSDAAIGSQTKIIVTEGTLRPDTLTVIIQGEERTAVIPNPFVPGKTDITAVLPPDALANYQNVLQAAGSNNVTLVVVEAPEPLAVVHADPTDHRFDSHADIRVYDAVGNLISDDCALIAGVRKLTYGISWDGTNRNGRKVGPGVYLMVIKSKRLISGRPYIISHKIGIGSRGR